MFPRLFVPVAVLAAWVLTAAMAPAAEPQEKMVQAVYQVADLVVPIGGGRGDVWQTEKLKTPSAEHLIRQIQRAVQPASWDSEGGQGTVQYFAPTMALVVKQTPTVQEKVVELLSRLRKKQATQVALEVRVVSVPEDLLGGCEEDGVERIGVNFEAKSGANDAGLRRLQEIASKQYGSELLDDKGLEQLLNAAAADVRTNVLSLPKLTVANRQTGLLNLTADLGPINTPSQTVFHLGVRPTASADRRFVRLEVGVDCRDQEAVRTSVVGQTVVIPDGGTVLLGGFQRTVEVRKEIGVPVLSDIPFLGDLFQSVVMVSEPRRVFVLVTPHIVVANEVEEKVVPSTSTGPCVCTMALPTTHDEPAPKVTKVLDELLQAYDAACAACRTEEADKLARAALILDPTCFRRK